jgi:hypothetical protein
MQDWLLVSYYEATCILFFRLETTALSWGLQNDLDDHVDGTNSNLHVHALHELNYDTKLLLICTNPVWKEIQLYKRIIQ